MRDELDQRETKKHEAGRQAEKGTDGKREKSGGERRGPRETEPSPRPHQSEGVLRSVIMMSATAKLTMKRLVAECIRWFLKMT